MSYSKVRFKLYPNNKMILLRSFKQKQMFIAVHPFSYAMKKRTPVLKIPRNWSNLSRDPRFSKHYFYLYYKAYHTSWVYQESPGLSAMSR